MSAFDPMERAVMEVFPNGWQHYLAGGLCIGLGTALVYLLAGRVAGMSTVFSAVWSYVSLRPFFQQAALRGSRGWRVWLAIGLVIGAALWWWGFGPGRQTGQPLVTAVPWWQLAVGGFLVGYGARRSGGCTSGHGICGLSSLQGPSLAAVLVFMATAMATAQIFLRLNA